MNASEFTAQRSAINALGARTVKPSLEKTAYQAIRNAIVNAEYMPGTLLSENELAERLGMSRTPIRAAINLLETEGFVESVKGRGVFVKEISFREFREMFEVLASMQLCVLDLAASRGLAFDMDRLRTVVNRQKEAAELGDNVAYYDCSLDFVGTMLASCGNAHMQQILDTIRGKYKFKMLTYRKQHAESLPQPSQARDANARIYDALLRGELGEARAVALDLNEVVYRQLSMFDI